MECSPSHASLSANTDGIHLYFPNIISNNKTSILLAHELVNLLYNNDKWGLSKEIYNKIVDTSVFTKNGLRMLFQIIDGSFYKINTKKSTYLIQNDSKIDHLRITSLK